MEKSGHKEPFEKLEQRLRTVSQTLEHCEALIDSLLKETSQNDLTQKQVEQVLVQSEKTMEALWNENQRLKQRQVSHTVSLMHQRRKAHNDVDDRYFEQELYIEAHEEIAEAITHRKEMLLKQNDRFQDWLSDKNIKEV